MIIGDVFDSGKRDCEYKQIDNTSPRWVGDIIEEIKSYVFECLRKNIQDGCICWGISPDSRVVGIEFNKEANTTLSNFEAEIKNELSAHRAGIPDDFNPIRKTLVFGSNGIAKSGFFIIQAFSPPEQEFINGTSVSSVEGAPH